MDPAASAVLRLRLVQQQHWLLAAAVRNGSQPRVDPDSDFLRELRGSERVYEAPLGSFVKRLVGGAWTLEVPVKPSRQPPDRLGPAALQLRLEQQRHWRLASAVRNGTQPGVDPDSHVLRELRGNERVYDAQVGQFEEAAWSAAPGASSLGVDRSLVRLACAPGVLTLMAP